MFGIDVSAHQGDIDWKKVKSAGVDFAIIRAGYGTANDKNFEKNYKGAKDNNILVGAYWFCCAEDIKSANNEQYLANLILHKYEFDLPFFYDIEVPYVVNLPRDEVSTIFKTFAEPLVTKGFKIGLYSSKFYLMRCFTDDILEKYPIWVAQWNIDELTYEKPYLFWQYSNKGSIAGISTAVDLNTTNNIVKMDYNDVVNMVADMVISGKFGNGEERKERLKGLYADVQSVVNNKIKEKR